MTILQEVLNVLEQIAPLSTAEEWDNVGLLLGDPKDEVRKIMTCLTITDSVLQEAIAEGIDLLVTHHPLPFKPLSRITSSTTSGRILLEAARHRIAIYSPHTAWDNARDGINAQIASLLGLTQVQPMVIRTSGAQTVGSGRKGLFAHEATVATLQEILTHHLPEVPWRCTHAPEHKIRSLGIVCGSGGSFVVAAKQAGCDALLTGEATYHQCLEGESIGIAVLLMGHFASEAFAMKKLATMIAASFPSVSVRASQTERSAF
jgi:dinuclear metal center YbgI/SA1388 family protein